MEEKYALKGFLFYCLVCESPARKNPDYSTCEQGGIFRAFSKIPVFLNRIVVNIIQFLFKNLAPRIVAFSLLKNIFSMSKVNKIY